MPVLKEEIRYSLTFLAYVTEKSLKPDVSESEFCSSWAKKSLDCLQKAPLVCDFNQLVFLSVSSSPGPQRGDFLPFGGGILARERLERWHLNLPVSTGIHRSWGAPVPVKLRAILPQSRKTASEIKQ